VEHAAAADGRQDQRQIDVEAKHRRRQIAVRRCHCRSGTEHHILERAHVFAQRPLPLGAAIDVVEHHLRQAALRHQPQIGDVHRF
jgi:hypothetical protein